MELILLENVAYLADDGKRAAAFATLKKKVGTRPEQILKASQKQLEEITRVGGIVPELRAQRLRQIAELVHWIFKDDLTSELKKPLAPSQGVSEEIPYYWRSRRREDSDADSQPCKRSRPLCEVCPLSGECRYFQGLRRG
ncbi:MAG: hypothetical protein LAO24_22080 [Acidobacteriia bacterium]|nr:hypothetical protein [Terriglobia bacterium]